MRVLHPVFLSLSTPQPFPKWTPSLYPAPAYIQTLSCLTDFVFCSSQELPPLPQWSKAGLMGASSFSHFFSLIWLKSGAELPWQMGQGGLDCNTSKPNLRHQRLWSRWRFWLVSTGLYQSGISTWEEPGEAFGVRRVTPVRQAPLGPFAVLIVDRITGQVSRTWTVVFPYTQHLRSLVGWGSDGVLRR